MRILFGPQHDGLHIDPNEPNGYEWWYFDAISDDEKYIVVVIYFLGTPMSPYYKAVVDGKTPLPKDWCGVFVSLHERTRQGYRECAYAYNIYSAGTFAVTDMYSEFFQQNFRVEIGDSVLSQGVVDGKSADTWRLSVKEQGLWLDTVQLALAFEANMPIQGEATGESNTHYWACIAPDCRVIGDITFGKKTISFVGRGYHDHNFGKLPWNDTTTWSWDRVHFSPDNTIRGAVHYAWAGTGNRRNFFAVWNHNGEVQFTDAPPNTDDLLTNTFAVRDALRNFWKPKRPIHRHSLENVENVGLRSFQLAHPIEWSDLQSAPFYHRCPVVTNTTFTDGHTESSLGIGEYFIPERLCGPIISQAMWTRIRRRS